MKKILLLFLTLVGMVSTASATDYYIGAEISSSWGIQGQMTDEDGDGTYSLIVNLPQQTGMYFTIFSENSTSDWNKAFRPDNTSSPWITNSVHEINMLESNDNDYSIYYPIGYDDANKNFARAIRIEYTPSTKKLNVTRLIVVASGYNGWSTTTDYIAETSCGSKIYQGYVTLEATSDGYDDGFKFNYFNYYNSKVNNDWGANNNGDLSNTASNYIVAANGVYELSADFNTWDWANPVLVTVPASVGIYGMATLCSEYALDFTDFAEASVKAYAITDNDKATGTLTKSQITGRVPAGTGLYIEGTANASINVPTTICTDDLDVDNMLKGVTSNTDISQTESTYTNYILTVNKAVGGDADTPKFFKVNDAGNTVPAGKAYLQIPTAKAAREFFWFDNETTAVNAIKQEQKFDGKVFNLAGQRIANPTKGLFIVNGKKVIK